MAISDDYVTVAERIAIFREKFPEGLLQPADPTHPYEFVNVGDKTFVVVVTAAYRKPDDTRAGIGMAWEQIPSANPSLRGSELMVAETSSWGRAIVAALAADTKRGVATSDEVTRANAVNRAFPDAKPVSRFSQPQTPRPQGQSRGGVASEKQVRFIEKLARDNSVDDAALEASSVIGRAVQALSQLTSMEASKVIEHFMSPSAAKKPAARVVRPEPQPALDDEEPF